MHVIRQYSLTSSVLYYKYVFKVRSTLLVNSEIIIRTISYIYIIMFYFISGIKKYVEFCGRATRKEYWMFVLFYILFDIFFKLIDLSFGTEWISVIYSLLLLLPLLGLSTRRLHDIGRSGWWQLLIFIPIIGILVLLYFYISQSDGNNQYGEKFMN